MSAPERWYWAGREKSRLVIISKNTASFREDVASTCTAVNPLYEVSVTAV